MRNRVFITTGIGQDHILKKDMVFAGDWCFLGTNYIYNPTDSVIIEYPVKPSDVSKIENQILETTNTIISRLAKLYNEHYCINESEKYYKIIFGRWIYHFLHNVYEKKALLEQAKAYYPDIEVFVCNKQADVSNDADSYSWRTYRSHVFNFRLFSSIAQMLPEIRKQIINLSISEVKESNPSNDLRVKLISFYQNVLCSLNRFFCKKMVIVVSPYYPRNSFYNSVWFFIKSKFRIVHYKFAKLEINTNKIDYALRENFADKIGEKLADDFLGISAKLLFLYMPKSFVEDFMPLKEESIAWCKKNKQTTAFFTANAIHTDERFKYLVAEKKDAELWISQHGFGYGCNKVISSEVYERELANKYFTWGWGKEVLPSPKLSLSQKISFNNKTRIVFTFPSLQSYAGLLETPLKYSYNINEFLRPSNVLVNNLEKEISDVVYVRQQKRDGLRFLQLDSIHREDEFATFQESLVNSRLHLTNHFGTPFLESLANNIPTIVIHSPLDNYFRKSVEKDFEMLKSANILFTDSLEASRHINAVYKSIDNWWQSDATQEIVKKFTHKYARSSKNWRNIWIQKLLN